MGRLDGKVAIVTGAASGIGRAIAKRFTDEGAAVVIADIDENAAAGAARQLGGGPGRAVYHCADVTSERDFKDVVEQTVKDFGRLNILVNNAGGGPWTSFERTTLEDWDKTFALTLRSVFIGMKLAIPELRKVGGGSIISIASNAGIRGMPPLHAYSAAKAGVINLTASVARLVGKDFIRVNCISPGLIATPAARGAIPDADAMFARAQAIPKAGAPEDIAAMALFLASDDSKWVTGATMVVDGGQNTAEPTPMKLNE